jgi:hypothetical protein
MKKNYIALGGLFACLHVLFLLAGKLFVGSELLLVLFLPLLSTLYTIKCDRKSAGMFVIATLLICFVFDFINTFIYVIPALICGITYGALRKKTFKELELLCVTGLVHMISVAFSFCVIVLLFKEIDFLMIFEKIFSLSGENLRVVALLSLLVIGFCEALLVHIVTDGELMKFGYGVEKNEKVPSWFKWVALICFVLFVILYFVKNLYSVFPMVLCITFFVPYIIEGMLNFKYKILTFSLLILFFFIAVFAMKYIEPLSYLIIIIFIVSPFSINCLDLKHK